MKFVIFHGSFGHPKENWIPNLEKALKSLEQEVIVPKFPTDDYSKIDQKGSPGKVEETKQNLTNWLQTFESDVLPRINKNEKLCFVGHSLGPLFILHITEKFNLQLNSAIFVSPFLKDLQRDDLWQFHAVNKTFYKSDFDFAKLKKLIPVSYVLYSDNDPYVPKEFEENFAKKLGSSAIIIRDGGHLNAEAGFTQFPLLVELCKTRLRVNHYINN